MISCHSFAAIEVAGLQAGQFLQGQVTCDIQTIPEGQAILGACCDHKGRMLVNFWIGRWQKNFILYLPKNMVSLTLEHLKKFAVFSKVTLHERPDWSGLIYSGATLPDLPFSSNETIHGQCDFLHWFFGPAPVIQQVTPVDAENLAYLCILAGLVFIQPETRELFIPQMINLEKLDGVSFTKGCYVGQEVIARTQHLGQLKRHLQRLQFESAQPIALGDSLFNDKQEIIGQIAAVSLENRTILAVIQDRALPEPIFSSSNQRLQMVSNSR